MQNQDNNTRLEKAYELYKLDWCEQREFDPEEVAKAYAEDREYNGSMYVSLEEFADNEYTDEEYIKQLFVKDVNKQLLNKMNDEQQQFRTKLMTLPPEKILEHAYEYAIRADIIFSIENNGLSGKQAKALLKSENPLADTYGRWQNVETHYMDDIRDNIVFHADEVLRKDFLKSNRDAR